MANRLCSFPVCVAHNPALIASVSARSAEFRMAGDRGMTIALLPYVPDMESGER